jgi:hypothetical protein
MKGEDTKFAESKALKLPCKMMPAASPSWRLSRRRCLPAPTTHSTPTARAAITKFGKKGFELPKTGKKRHRANGKKGI